MSSIYRSQMAHCRLRNKHAKKNKRLSAYHDACINQQRLFSRVLSVSERKRLYKYFMG